MHKSNVIPYILGFSCVILTLIVIEQRNAYFRLEVKLDRYHEAAQIYSEDPKCEKILNTDTNYQEYYYKCVTNRGQIWHLASEDYKD
jgi:hypothetical protein